MGFPYRSMLLATSILAAPAVGFAQNAPSSTVQEVVVTAQRRTENVLSVPMAIQAASGQQLSNAGINTITDLQFTTPGYVPSDSAGSVNIFIRGIGNSTFFADPSVATFIDDVPRINAVSSGNLADVQRVEILKGAQGGLYGLNATGGVLNIITRQPTNKFQADASVSYGEKNTLKASAYVNMPLNDKVAWNVSVQRDSHDAYVQNLDTNSHPYTAAMFPSGFFGLLSPQQFANLLNSRVQIPHDLANQNFWAMDSKIRIQAADNFKITLAGDYANKNDTYGSQYYESAPSVLRNTLQGIYSALSPGANIPVGFIPTVTKPFTQYRGGGDPLIPIQDYGGSVTAVYSVPNTVDITSITAYRRLEQGGWTDFAGAIVPFGISHGDLSRSFIYQEFRFVSTNSGPFHWLGGATYEKDVQDDRGRTEILPPLGQAFPAFFGSTFNATTVDVDTETNWSAYGQGSYDITRDLSLTASLRWVSDQTDVVFTGITGASGALIPPPPGSNASLHELKFLPAANLTYKLPGEGIVYARFAEGFKAGGVTYSEPPVFYPTNVGKLFKGESVDTYEIGIKTPLLDRKMQVTADVFYNDYTNLQESAYGNYPPVDISTVNVQAARTYGAEASVTWRVIPPVTISANAGYLNAHYTKFIVPVQQITQGGVTYNVINGVNESGFQMTNAPEWQASFTVNLDQPINDKFNVIGSLLASYMDTIVYSNTTQPAFPPAVTPSFWLVNLRLGLRTADDKYEVAVDADNLFNQANWTYGNSGSSGDVLAWGDPRIVRFEVKAKF